MEFGVSNDDAAAWAAAARRFTAPRAASPASPTAAVPIGATTAVPIGATAASGPFARE